MKKIAYALLSGLVCIAYCLWGCAAGHGEESSGILYDILLLLAGNAFGSLLCMVFGSLDERGL